MEGVRQTCGLRTTRASSGLITVTGARANLIRGTPNRHAIPPQQQPTAPFFGHMPRVESHFLLTPSSPRSAHPAHAHRSKPQPAQQSPPQSTRGTVANQEVILGTQSQTLTIRHDTIDRASFMPGVVLACKKIAVHQGFTLGLDKFLNI